MRIGVFGGAFNPPHIGHLVCAQEALDQLELDRLLLVPVARPPHRELEGDPGGQVRLRMCELAIAGTDERLEVSRLELERDGPSYMADTLGELHRREVGAELVLVLGGDQASRLGSWERPAEVLELARVAVAERQGVGRAQVASALDGLVDEARLEAFEIPRLDISSSAIRRRVTQRRSIRYLVEENVRRLIANDNLYVAGAVVRG